MAKIHDLLAAGRTYSFEFMPPRTDEMLRQLEKSLRELGPGMLRSQLEAVRDRLQEPLRVAVMGRTKAGKSTIVNALLRQRVLHAL